MPPKKKPSKAKRPASRPPAPQPIETGRQGSSPSACPVVAFGASAGGLEAFQEVLENLPEDTGLAFVFIQHLDPKHTSVLGELLARSTRMPVVPVKDRMRVEPNRLYVIPPNVGMRLELGRLLLTQRPDIGPHMPIDEFFRSLAEDQGSRSIAVVLSGTASDGTLGLKAVKAVGGITFAQDQTARFDAMPRNAIAAGWVDLVLPPDQIAHEIRRLCQHPYVTAEPAVAESAPSGRMLGEPDRFLEIFQMLRAATGVDFMLYKQGTLHRRILRRMALNKMETEEQYAGFLREDRTELQSLFHDILISVTGFFREAATFEALKKDVFPDLFRNRTSDNPVRVWVPGCSTGEEAYSVAICLMEYMQDAGLKIPIQIFGTDLSEPALARARTGIYPESVAADVLPERLRRFFVKVDGQYQISRPVRDKCIFAQQNFTKDPPFSKLDLITCRNVLIYLGPALQAKAMRFFHYALKPSGFLVLGLSETVGNSNQLFNPIDNKLKIYARLASVPVAGQHADFGARADDRARERTRHAPPVSSPHDGLRQVDHYILSHYSPAGVLIDEEMNILQFQGHTAPYLEHSAGDAALNVNRMLRRELVLEFRKLFDRSRKSHTTVRSRPICVSHLNRVHQVTICIAPMVPEGGKEIQYLVLFEELPPSAPAPHAFSRPEKPGISARRVRELEEELNSTKQYLESVIEEQQAATEELKSANEEVQSSNEELQSTNEELLTAKEELQSTNEELITVNEEMHSRNAELIQVNNDLNNLLSSVNIPIVMLGNDLRIRRFTPQAEKVLNLLPTDVGRLVGDFRSKIDIPDLDELFVDAIENLRVKERQVQDRDGRWFSMWIRPYRTVENRIDGAVLVLFDITERKQAAEARYRRLFEASREGIILADCESGEIIDLNPSVANTFGISRGGSIGVKYWDLEMFRGTEMDRGSLREFHESETLQRNLAIGTKAGGWRDVEVIGHVYWEGEKRIIQINVRDVSERRRQEDGERRTQGEAQQAVEIDAIGRLAGAIAHDFNNLLTTVGGYAQLLKRDLAAGNPVAEDVAQIGRAMERATLLTGQVLAFGRRHHPLPEVLDLNELLREIELIIRATLPARMELRIECGAGLRLVKVERGQMEQAVLNLARHARQAVPGSGTLIIATRNTTIDEEYAREHPAVSPGDYVVLEVSNIGPRADEARLQVLEPLLSASDNRYAALSVAGIYDAVRRSGGHLWAASELGRGNTFRIFLPPAGPALAESAETTHSGALEKGGETILLVEPEEMVRSLTARILAECGYTVIEASQGREALELVRQWKEPAHLVLTEVVMPEMSGRELADKIASLRHGVRVLFTSGHADDVVESHGVPWNERAFLRKPFTPEALSQRIREVLKG